MYNSIGFIPLFLLIGEFMKKIIKSFFVIFLVLWLGGVIKKVIPLPIPDMIYAMIMLFIFLYSKILKLDDIEEVAGTLLSVFSFFFVPASVGLIDSYKLIQNDILKIFIILIISFFFTILSIAYTIKFVKRYTDAE